VLAVGLGLGGASAAGAAAGGSQGPGTTATTIVHTTDDVDDTFESNIGGCEGGTATEGRAMARLMRTHGVFNGQKVFTCSGGEGGFTVHLNAWFTFDGSIGTWSTISSWGTLAGMQGQGKLVGTVIPGGIDDSYEGWISFAHGHRGP
jgi:hypothetical protein